MRSFLKLLLALSGLLLSCNDGAEQTHPPNVFGVISHRETDEPLPGLGVDALTSASPSRRRIMDEDVTDEDGYYELALEPRTYVIRPDVHDGDDCFGDLYEVELDIEAGAEYELDFAFVPPPCP